ncbi:hypothetical protein [Paraburkholderia tropica]|uniref:hypothetical protein n=1 Tax=Paraburkholderia tropica TaxID=92647 RepID=UPI002AB6303C|nr:hypothetical protein [Paraburkholderia tropica]
MPTVNYSDFLRRQLGRCIGERACCDEHSLFIAWVAVGDVMATAIFALGGMAGEW